MSLDGAAGVVTVFVQVLVHPSAVVTVTVYSPAALAEMQFVVAPVLHK
jgi:hypothetical protein